MRPIPHFLALPRELRDMIYVEHVRMDNSCFFDFRTGKLTAENNQAVDLSFMYTCRLIKDEVLSVFFKENTIVFTTVSSFKLCVRAGCFSDKFSLLRKHETDILHRVSPLIKPCMVNEVLKYFPQNRPQMDLSQNNPVEHFLHTSYQPPFVETPLEHRAFVRHLILKAQEHHRFWEFASDHWRIEPNPIDVLAVDLAPWAVPSDKDLDDMEYALSSRIITKKRRRYDGRYSGIHDRRHEWGRRRYSFSAASAAI